MNKLGFAIKYASAGAGTALECNKDLWLSKVCDIRDYLKLFNGLKGTNNTVSFMSFDEKGCFLTILRAQSGRDGDYISAWIYIPNNILISGEQVEKAHDFAKTILAESNLNELKFKIDEFFSQEYPQKEVFSDYLPSGGEDYAGRFIGHYSFKEILDKDRYQPYYSKFKAIFLLYKNSEVTVSKESGKKIYDLTQQPIEKTYILMPPTDNQLLSLGRNVKIVFENGAVFNKAFPVKANSEVVLYLVKGPFEPIRCTTKVSEEVTRCDVSSLNPEWQMKISRSIFNVVDSDKNKVTQYNMTIGSQMLGLDAYIFIPENQLTNAHIFIDSPKYEDFYGKFDLTQQPINIVLERKGREASWTLMLPNNREAEVIVRSKYINSNVSPFKGYYLNSLNMLVEDSLYKWKQRFIGFLLTLGIIALIGVYSVLDSCDWNPFNLGKDDRGQAADVEQIGDIDNSDQETETLNLSENAKNYLETVKVWKKDSLEKYDELKGLYDFLNQFDFEGLLSKFQPLSSYSSQLNSILQAARTSQENNWNPRVEPHFVNWNKDKGTSIDVEDYIKWVSSNHVKPEPQDLRGTEDAPQENTSSGFNPNRKKIEKKSEKNKDKKTEKKTVTKSGNSGSNLKNGGL